MELFLFLLWFRLCDKQPAANLLMYSACEDHNNNEANFFFFKVIEMARLSEASLARC